MENTFRVGDPVWGKVKGFSAWPGKIILPPDGLKVISKYLTKTHYNIEIKVYFVFIQVLSYLY